MEIIIDEKHDGVMLSNYLKYELKLSGRSISRLKRVDDGILLCGRPVTVRAILSSGDTLCLATEDRESPENIVATDLPIDIIYEDDDIVAVNKPFGMPTHPSHGHYTDTLANALAFYYKERNIPFVFRVITRLDRDTSGIVLVAKNKDAAYRLSGGIASGEIRKCYLALTKGAPTKQSGEIIAYIRRVAESIIMREATDEPWDGAAYSKTLYEVIGDKNGVGAIAASPITGRTHQLRLHFAHIGAPMLGDDMYGFPSKLIGRQALHAYSLCFAHPRTGEQIRLTAPLPTDIISALERSGYDADALTRALDDASARLAAAKTIERKNSNE